MSETMIAIAVLSIMLSLVHIAKAAWDAVEALQTIARCAVFTYQWKSAGRLDWMAPSRSASEQELIDVAARAKCPDCRLKGAEVKYQ